VGQPDQSTDQLLREFDLFYRTYPRKERRGPAQRRWRAMSAPDRADAMAAAVHYAAYAADNPDAPLMLPATFLSRADRCWVDWVDGVPESRRRQGQNRNGRNETTSADLYAMAAEMRASRQLEIEAADDVIEGDAL
jgi:hypothetical protein